MKRIKLGTIQFCKKLNGNSRASEILAEPSLAAENKNPPQHESKCDQHFDNAVTKPISGGFILIGISTQALLCLLWFLGKDVFELTKGREFATAILLDIFAGILLTIPLLLFNYLMFFKFPSEKRHDFVNSKVKPLCKALSLPVAAIISASAGLGEEFFFRDLLLPLIQDYSNSLIALAVSSFLFAYLHFMGQAKAQFELLLIYTLVGAYFGLIVISFGSILPAIICHALYDFLAIMFVKHLDKKALI